MQDRQLIETLFRRYYERMFLTARTLLRDPEEARDVVSDVFAELMESRQALDMKRVEEANRLYNSLPSHDRNDAMAMQYLIPGWKYDHKKPCLVR